MANNAKQSNEGGEAAPGGKLPSKRTQWLVEAGNEDAAAGMTSALGISPVLARVLVNRGIQTPEKAGVFLKCRLDGLGDPLEVPGMKTAVERVLRALAEGKPLVLYADYDVDGVTSAVVLRKILMTLAAAKTGEPHSRVAVFLPDRFEEGYGLTMAGVRRCLEEGCPDVLVALDCGTNSRDEIALLQAGGTDVVVLDHHEPAQPARPLALVNCKQFSPDGNGTEYCAAGLVFKFAHALLKMIRAGALAPAGGAWETVALQVDLKQYLDLTALATVVDMAPLTGENRLLTRHGLKMMGKTRWVGLRALMDVAKVAGTPGVFDCGFKLGPRLNAAGRLETARLALDLLQNDDLGAARRQAMTLDRMNQQRRDEEARVLKEAREAAMPLAGDGARRVLVVARSGWHEGVVGIVAARLVQEFDLPAFVLSLDDEGKAKGSGRSMEGFDLAEAISATRSFLIKGGGHAMAAGVTLEADKVAAWDEALQIHSLKCHGPERIRRMLRIDAELSLALADMALARELERLEPCGIGNRRPVFAARAVEVSRDPVRLGVEGRHLKLWLRQDRVVVEAIAFGHGNLDVKMGQRLDVAFELGINEFRGERKVQLTVRELAVAE
ncbi:MAG: single-stranded-DNA-specific exonuclease RecJ [Verrucomicrobiae bacterium]|nr:single-stranded-DNA-specific exonuclease RecJ [Verrucomicrobiae bacterium]